MSKISKVLEIENCNKEILIKALYNSDFWITIKPTKEMEGGLVLIDKGEEEGKGRVIEFNVRNNKDVRELEGRLRVKSLSASKSKVGVFIENFKLSSDFLNLIGSAADLTLQIKITDMLRNLQKYCKSNDLNHFLEKG